MDDILALNNTNWIRRDVSRQTLLASQLIVPHPVKLPDYIF